MLVLDDMDTSALRSGYVIRAARQFVEKHFADGDTAAVVYTSGQNNASQEFTSDRALLLAAIDKFRGVKLRSAVLDKLDGYYQQQALAAGLAAQMDGEPVNPDSDLARSANPFSRGSGYADRTYDLNDLERGQRAITVLDNLRRMADFLSNVRGRRKALVFFSEGIDYPVTDIFSAANATTVVRATEDAIAAAARANVNFYTVDPRGLVGLTSEYIELNKSNSELFNIGSRDARYGLQPQTALLDEMRLSQDSLRTLAEETGGLAVINANSFTTAFDRIVQANSTYYVIGYYPATTARDGRFHRIEVRVNRPGLRVASRKGYAFSRPKTPADLEKEAAQRARTNAKSGDMTSPQLRDVLAAPLQRSGLTLTVQAAAFKNNPKTASVALAIEIDGAALQFTPQNGNTAFSDKLELSFFSINEQNKPLDGMRTEFDLTLRPETYQRVKTVGLRANPRIALAPGRYQLRIGARESGAGRLGSVFYDLLVPDFTREPLMMSGLLVTSDLAQATPTVQADAIADKLIGGPVTSRRDFLTQETLGLFAEIYDVVPASTPHQVDISIRLLAEDGREAFISRESLSSADLFGQGKSKSASYGLGRQVPLRDIPPGRYLLRVEAQVRGNLGGSQPAARETLITVQARQ